MMECWIGSPSPYKSICFFFHFLHSFMNTICLDITTTITNVYLIFWILLALQRRPSNRTNNRIIIIGFNVYNTIVQFIGRIWIIDLVTVYVACCCFGWSIFHFNFFVAILVPNKRIPPMVEASKCRFPDWMQGRWQRTKVDNQQFIYKDAQNQFRTIRSRCIQRQSDLANDRFIVHSITQWLVLFNNHVWRGGKMFGTFFFLSTITTTEQPPLAISIQK